MESPTTTGRWTLNRIVALFLAAGFFFLLVEIRIEHDRLLATKPLAYIPLVFSLIAFLTALVGAFRWKPAVVKSLLVISLLAIPVGFGGLWFHNEDRIEERGGNEPRPGDTRGTAPEEQRRGEQRPVDDQLRGEQRPGGEQSGGEGQRVMPERRSRRRHPPILAPAAFLGMGLLGTLIALRRWPGDVA